MRLRADELARFHQDGFLILPELFSAAEMGALKDQLPALFAERRPENFREKRSDVVRTAMALHLRNDSFARLVRQPRLIGPAMQLLGPELYIPAGQGQRQRAVRRRGVAMALRFRHPPRRGRGARAPGPQPAHISR